MVTIVFKQTSLRIIMVTIVFK